MLRSLSPLMLIWAVGCHCTTAPDVLRDTSPPEDSVPGEDTEPPEDTAPERYHPDDYADADVHGAEARLQTQSCTSCHGEDLMGVGLAVSCDGCHADGWRSDCLFCHGGQDDETGAPPLHVSGQDDGADAWFPPHSVHVLDTETHAAFGCEQCHTLPSDALSDGHLFLGDDSPARGEADFSAGIDSTVGWDDSRTCVSSWCHGDGQSAAGRVEVTDEVEGCGACHEDQDSGTGGWRRMTGEHAAHLDRGMTCRYCHQDVTGEDNAIVGLELHVNGAVDVALADSWVTWESGTCDGLCHIDGFWYWHWTSGWDE